MPKQTHLIRRGAVYYYRARVPSDIQNTYGRKEEYISLKTKDYQEALRLVRHKSYEIQTKFDKHRKDQERLSSPPLQTISPEQLKHIQDTYYAHLLDEDEETRLHGFYDPSEEELPALPLPTFDEYQETTKDLSEITRSDHAKGKTDIFYQSETEEVLRWDGIGLNVDDKSIAFKQITRELQKAAIRAQESIHKRNEGFVVDTPATPQSGLSDSLNANTNAPLLSEVLEKWVTEKSLTSWTPKTANSHETWTKAFITAFGDKPINQYTKADAKALKDTLLYLPSNWSKHHLFKNKNIQEAATIAQSNSIAPMSLQNSSKILRFVASLWVWMLGHYDEIDRNIFDGIIIKATSDPRKARDSFTIDELKTIFSAPIFTGCASPTNWKQVGSHSMQDTAKYWTPIISLYSGMRMGEILQLHTNDIKEENGIHYFDINIDSEDKSLKTQGSERNIPIHAQLISLGFLELITRRTTKGSLRVFPEITKGNDDTYTDGFSKHFSRFLREVNVKNKKNSFHSFRHTFEDACRENDVPKEIMDALQGHVSQDMSGRYGSGYSLQKLNEGLQKVRYSGLELPNQVGY